MNDPQSGNNSKSKPPSDRLRELERGLAYEFCCAVIESELNSDPDTTRLAEALTKLEWFDPSSDAREDELIPECIEYLTLRGLIQRDPEMPGMFAILDESEGVA